MRRESESREPDTDTLVALDSFVSRKFERALMATTFAAWRAWFGLQCVEIGQIRLPVGDRRRLFFLEFRCIACWGEGWEWARLAMESYVDQACQPPARTSRR